MNYQFLCDYPENLENKINILLASKQFYWSEIYIFSAFFDDAGVTKVKQILSDDSLTEDAKVVIAIGSKNFFNEIKNIKEILDFIKLEKSKKLKNKSVHFICPKNNFHIKAYCFLGRSRNVKIKADIQIGVSIIGSSNLTRPGLKCEGELCISIHKFNLTKTLIARLSKIYIDSNEYDLWGKIINEYKNNQYNSWVKIIKEFDEKINKYNGESSENQNEDPQPLVKAESKYVQDQAPITSTPGKGKFIKLGVMTDSVLRAQATNLANDSENIDCFHSSPSTIEQAKDDFPEGSLCLLLTENKILEIVEIRDYEDNKQQTQGCFIIFKFKVKAFSYDDIREILDNEEEYKKIKRAEEEYEEYIKTTNQYPELEYATLNMFEEKVQEYQNMLADPNYKKGLEKGEEKMQSKIDGLLKEIEKIDAPSLKERLKKLL
ncbi:phospholipase D-like domain-containing protein [Microcoleus sp. Pol14C2]|uniref:hypothetical protein n=1 Tax=unclassified Microcoleus TaxID=2642155 RepID=UPI002FD4BDB9